MRRLPFIAATALLTYLLYRRAAAGRRRPAPQRAGEAPLPEEPQPPEPGGPIPETAEPPGEPSGLAAGELSEGVWPGRAEALVRERFPVLTDADLASAGNDLERLAAIAAERTHRPVQEVYEELLQAAREASPLDQGQGPL